MLRFRFLLFLIPTLLTFSQLTAQFDPGLVELRLGYNIHNSHAKHFNHLINIFNAERHGIETSSNLGNLKIQHGISFGANYELSDDFILHFIFKNKHQYIQAKYVDYDEYRKYLFRSNTVELGFDVLIADEKRFKHYVGAGMLIGALSAYTDWTDESGYRGTKDMLNIDHSLVVGLSISYEARIVLHEYFSIYIRPVFQYSLPSNIQHLNAFMNPDVSDGNVTYDAELSDKYNKGALNGAGIETGLLIALPEFGATKRNQ